MRAVSLIIRSRYSNVAVHPMQQLFTDGVIVVGTMKRGPVESSFELIGVLSADRTNQHPEFQAQSQGLLDTCTHV